MCESFSKTRTCLSHAKNQPWGSSSFFNKFCTYKHIYAHIHVLYLRFNSIDTVNSRYNQVGYNEIIAYNEMEIFTQSTKCINYYPLITNIRI